VAAAKTDELSRLIKTAEAENQRAADRVRMDIKNMGNELVEKVSIELARTEKEYAARLDEAAKRGETLETAALSKLKEHIEGKLKTLSSELSGRIESGRTDIEKKMNSFSAFIDGIRGEAASQLEKAKSDNAEAMKEYETSLKDKLDGLEGSLYQSEKSVEERVGRLDSLINDALEEYTVKIEGVRTEGIRLGENVLAQCRGIAADNEERLKEEISVLSGSVGRAAEVSRDLSEKTKSLDAALRRFVSDYELRITETGEAMETRVVGNLEARLADYEKDISYRFSGIEGVFGDIQNLEKSLKDTMDRIALKVREDFSAFGKDMQEKQITHKAELDASMREIHSALDEVEAGLAELKSRAYDNVSEKLKIFEDDFFQDLRNRDQAIQEKWIEWQSGVDSSLDVLAKENEEKRAHLEARYTEGLKNRFVDFQGKMNTQMAGWKEEAGNFQRDLQGRLDFSDESIKTFRAGVEEEVGQAKSSAEAFLREELARHNTLLDKDLDKFTKGYEVKLQNLTDALDEKQSSASALLDAIRSDVTVWQTELLQKIKESEADINNQVAGLKVNVSDSIASLQEEFTRQRNDLIQNTREERASLKEELRRLETQAASLRDDIGKKTEEALTGFESRFTEFNDTLVRETGEFESSSDEKIRVFRASLQDTRQQFDALHQKLFGSIEDKSQLLTVNLAEIDKRQKNFIEQTKIFERADSLKETLRTNIEELKADIAQTESHRKEIQEAETQFQKIRKLGEEVSEKLSRFTADKRRIDTLEEDYGRLISMSETVKQKIQNVAGFDDEIEAVQASFRTLQTLQGEVEVRFDRLEKKGKLVDTTAEGVERNQMNLAEMEKKLSSFRHELDLVPESLDTLMKKTDGMKAFGDKLDAALKQFDSIDTLLGDLEKRTEKLQKTRDWLARTETRMGELNRDIQERIKLFGSVLKEEAKTSGSKRSAKTTGAPSLSSRDIVRKLAREGWTVEQIAANTKLSRGEVELILEMPPAK
jgi:DNA repair exonuclease SbcCD ATPase subunit